MPDLNILALSGSLRARSFNTSLLRAAVERAPEGVNITLGSIAEVPLYDGDLDQDERRPGAVDRLKEAIANADAVLIATPEYNYGLPGVLKNALDWASRPAYRSPFYQKPVAIVSAAPGMVGGARAQGQLKQILLGMGSQVFPYPEFLAAKAGDKFDADGRLTDASTDEHLHKLLTEMARWVRKVAA